MLAWEQMHQHQIENNENRATNMINQFNNWTNNINDNDIIHRREVVELLTVMNMTVNTVRNTYENQMNLMRQHMEDINREIGNLRREVTRLNNSVDIHHMPAPPVAPPPVAPAPVAPAPAPLAPAYTKEDLCAELLDSIEDTKHQMQDQTYRRLTEKLMEIYNR